MGIGQLAIAAVVILAVLGLLFVAVRAMKVPVPEWFWQVVGIVLAAVVIILAIKFVMTL